MTRTWEDFPVTTDVPVVVEDRTRDPIVRIGDVRFLELPDNGYQLLIAWHAGPGRVRRVVDNRTYTVTSTTYRKGDPVPEVRVDPRTEEDWRIIDEMVNSYLQDAGVPPRPRGYLWYVELPAPLVPGDLWRAVNTRVGLGEKESIRQGLAELYGTAQ